MWTARISKAQFEVLLEGKTLEIVIDQGVGHASGGLLTIDQSDDEAWLVIRFLTREEAGMRL